MRLAALFLLLSVAIALIAPATGAMAEDKGFRLSSNQEVSEVVPEVPVRIKLKKLADGTYTWEISGTDVQSIIDADSALRKYIKANNLKSR